MSDQPLNPGERADLAGEYALGVLTGADLRTARELERTDAKFRQDVARWRARLAPLADEVDDVEPPAEVWRSIDQQTGGGRSPSNVVALRRQVDRWRAAATLMTALAACLAVVLLVRLPNPLGPTPVTRAGAPMVAMLGNDQQAMKIMASWDPAGRRLVLAVPGEMPSDPSHAHELWVIPATGKPHSLGTMPARKQMHMELAEAIARLLQQGATIAVSVEPPGGSPTGRPTGSVIASGRLTPA